MPPDVSYPVKKALLPSIENIEFPTEPIIPFMGIVHDRAVVETFRGCTRGCRFCQAGIIYRPIRERSLDRVKEIAKNQLKNTGHEELSLLSLSTSDYSNFKPLVLDLMSHTLVSIVPIGRVWARTNPAVASPFKFHLELFGAF